MKPTRKLSRRSFLTRVAGGAIVGGGAMIALSGSAHAQATDGDSGANADPAGRGRGGAGNRIRGCTDADSGANADPPSAGRGNRTTDGDPSDPARCGRRGR
jgi:hypothetical protein